MRPLRASLLRLAGMFHKRDIDAEIESHLQLHIDDNLRAGMTPLEARRQAVLKLGGVQPTREAYRDRGTVPWLRNLAQDTRFAIRQLRKSPAFTATSILMLALGTCASVSIFAFVESALIKPLPYRDPSRLAAVFETAQSCPRCDLSYLDYVDWERMNTVFTSLAVFQGGGSTLIAPAGARRAPAARVSDNFFRTLGIAPVLGRDFYEGEDLPSAPRTVMLSYAAWQGSYAGDRAVLGRTVTLDGEPHVIIGVLPLDFHFAPVRQAEFFRSLQPINNCDRRRSCHNLYGVARLKDGVSLESANAEMRTIASALEKQYPDSNRGQGANILALTESIVGRIGPVLRVLLGGAGLLLLIAAINVASLLLVRSESRKREIAVRRALGASSGRVLGQFVTEGVVLVLAGCALGVAGAWWAIRLLLKLVPADMLAGMPYLRGIGLNPAVYAFAAAIAVAAAALFALTPALHLSFLNTRDGLAQGTRGSSGNVWRKLGSKLVMLELAITVVLLVSAGLLAKSLYRVLNVDVGFQPRNLAMLRVTVPAAAYPKPEQLVALERRIMSAIAVLPGVQSAGVASSTPLSGGNTVWIRVIGQPFNGEHNEVQYREASPGYFPTLGARLVRGRFFAEDEDASKPPVILINQALAKRYFPGEDPLGRQLGYASFSQPPMTVVGLVEDIKESPLDEETRPAMYVAFRQDPSNGFGLVVRTANAAGSLLPALTASIHAIDPAIATANATTMSDFMRSSAPAYLRRGSAFLVGAFAAAALLLSLGGLYGVIAYSVSHRTREIGVRIALGAQPRAIFQLVLREAGWLAAAGIAVGIGLSLAAAGALKSLLFDVRSWDFETLAGVALVLSLAALLASYLPARRAASVDPVKALRAE